MNYSYKQLIPKRKILPGDKRVILLLWLSFLIPILIPQIFIPYLFILLIVVAIDAYYNPYLESKFRDISFDVIWPDFLELNCSQKVNINWNSFHPSLHLKILFPSEFSPRVFHLHNGDFFFNIRSKKKGTYGNIDFYVGHRSKLGLFYYYYKMPHERKIYVAPPILYLSVKHLQNNEKFNTKRYLGGESDFHSLRQYQVGDPLKHINWKKTAAHMNEVYVNEYHKEQNRKVLIIMNTGIASRFEYKGYQYLDYQTALAFQLAYTFVRNQDQTGLLAFSDRVDLYVPPDLSRNQLPFIFQHLQKVEESYEHMGLIDLYTFLKGKLQRKSILIFLSPFFSFQQMYVQRKIIHLLSQNYQVIWANPLRIFPGYYNRSEYFSHLWAKVHILKEKQEEEYFFKNNHFSYVHERPEDLYKGVIRHYSSLKW